MEAEELSDPRSSDRALLLRSAPAASRTTNNPRQPTNTNCTIDGTWVTRLAATPPEPSNDVSTNTTSKRNISCQPIFRDPQRWLHLAQSARDATIGAMLKVK